jgi:hypothetical protein
MRVIERLRYDSSLTSPLFPFQIILLTMLEYGGCVMLGSAPLCFFQFFAQFDYDLRKIKSDHQKSLVLELLRGSTRALWKGI